MTGTSDSTGEDGLAPGPISRRSFVKYGGVLAAVAGLSGVGAGAASAQDPASRPRQGATTAPPGHTVALYDMHYLYSLDLSDPAQAASAYDQMQLVFTLQGIVNRDGPRLYVKFDYQDYFGSDDLDGYWLTQLQEPGGLLHGWATDQVSSLEQLIQMFRPLVRGAVVWDPEVWATSNAATTVAGVDDLVAVRYDTTSGSVYQQYVAGEDSLLPGRVWLVNRDGSSLFTGSGTIPGTDVTSSGSAKCDAYLWAKAKYLDTKRCGTGELGYYVDAYWLAQPADIMSTSVLLSSALSNLDYVVSQRAFVFDLSPWGNEEPIDDPHQPLGTDLATLEGILLAAYRQAGGAMTAIHGFPDWQLKYSNSPEAGGNNGPVATEWEFVQIATGYNCYLDADAIDNSGIGAMANASVYTHVPLRDSYSQPAGPTVAELQQRGYVDADGSVVPKRYVMFYLGDFDSAAWMYQAVPRLWNDPNRGSVPLNWAFDPELSDRIAPAFLYTRATRSDNDFFIAGDSGAGYVNPSVLEAPRASGLPSGLTVWQRHCSRYFRLWDISITGFIIDGNAPAMTQSGLQTYAQFSYNGFAEQYSAELGIVGTTPYLQMPSGFAGTVAQVAPQIEAMLDGDTSQAPYVPEWHSARITLETPTYFQQLAQQVQSDVPDAEVVFLDAPTFYALIRQYLEDQVVASTSGPYVSVVTGQSVPVTIGLTSYAPRPTSGTVSLSAPPGWTVSPASVPFSLASNATGSVTVNLEAAAAAPLGQAQEVEAVVTVNDQSRSYGFETITYSSGLGTATVSVTLGATNVTDGLSQLEYSGDGATQAVTLDGQSARETVEVVAGDLNMYFALQPGIAANGNFQAAFTVDYYDSGTNVWVLQYDSNNASGVLDGAYTTAATVTNADTKTWKTLNVTVDDARFDGRENDGSDFRINSGSPVAIHSVSVAVSGYGVNPA